jgi:hypothetical protein
MLYKFKSEAAADVIMLEATGRQVLQIIGKGPQAKGILMPTDMPAAKVAIEHAIALEESTGSTGGDNVDENAEAGTRARVSLRARVWPLVTMMERSMKMNKPITWGV